MPDGPVMDDVTLCTVGVLLSGANVLINDVMCSNIIKSSLESDRVGGGGGDTVEGRVLKICALIDGTVFDETGRNESDGVLVDDGLK